MKPKIVRRKFQNKDGSYHDSKEFYIRYTLNGKLKYENTHETVLEKAKQYKSKYLTSYDGSKPEFKKDSLLDYLENNGWLNIETNPLYKAFNHNLKHGIQERTAYHMANDLSKLVRTGDKILRTPYQRITRKDTFEFRERLAEDNSFFISRANKNQLLNFLRTVYSFIIRTQKEAIITENPFSSKILDRFQYKDIEKSKYVFQPEEIRQMFDEDTLNRVNPSANICSKQEWETIRKYYLKVFKFLAYTGTRISECLASKVSQVDSHVMVINQAFKDPNQKVVRLPKTNEERVIVLSQSALESIQTELLSKEKGELIFTNSVGHMIHASSADYYFQIFKKVITHYLGVGSDMKPNEYMCLHSFRKSFNTNLVEQGVGIKESFIAAYCGWATSKTAEMAPVQASNYTESQLNSLYLVACEVDRLYSDKKMKWRPSISSNTSLVLKEKKAILFNDSDLVAIIKFQRILNEAIRITMRGNLNSSDNTYNSYEQEFTEISDNLESISYEQFSQFPLVHLKKVFEYNIAKCAEIDNVYNSILKKLLERKELEEHVEEEIKNDPDYYNEYPDMAQYMYPSNTEFD